MRYCLLAWRCASHQVNLAVHVAICGKLVKEPVENNDICANVVRLYKYLIPDYMQEFTSSLRQWVSQLELLSDSAQALDGHFQPRTDKMLDLYGSGVLPPSILKLFNHILGQLVHRCPSESVREEVRRRACGVLIKHLFVVEEKPVVTRFWLFSSCVNRMLCMLLIGLPPDIFKLSAGRAAQEGQKRLSRFMTYYRSPSTSAELRKAVLCLRLTSHALNITAKHHLAAEPDVPMLVQLGRGIVQRRTSQQLQSIITLLPEDESLHLLGVLTALFTTQLHIVIRFQQYREFPTKLWEICQKWNPAGYATAAQNLLEMADDDLDLGYTFR